MGMIECDVYMESMLMSSGALDDGARAFREAAEAFGEIVARPEVGKAWEQPSVLSGLTVGGIVGHVNAGIGWLGPLLDAPVQPDLRPSPRNTVLGFFSGLKIGAGGADRSPLHDIVDHQAERAARHGWEANRDKFRGLAERLAARLEGESGDRLLDLRPTAPLVVRLADWLPSRVLELVVHTDDLAASVGTGAPLPESAATVTIDLMVAIARAVHGDVAVVRALARRERADSAVFPVF